jgi:hypothetical protein
MQSKVVVSGFVVAVAVFAFGVATPITAQQVDAANLAEDAREVTAKGAWRARVSYDKDDLVTSRGSTWRSKRDNNRGNVPGSTQPNNAADWELFAAGLNPAGAWLGSKTYHRNDLVTHLGETWRAKRTSKSIRPAVGADWEKFAAAGEDGAPGVQGSPGVQGMQGPPGPSNVGDGTQAAPSFSFTDDPNTGMFSPANGKIALVEDGVPFLHNMGTDNTALGFSALESNTTGNSNTALGYRALRNNITGGSNTALGLSALHNNTAGEGNTAVGRDALFTNAGNSNTAIGRLALAFNDAGNSNTALGFAALQNNTTGGGNIAIGVNAGINTTTTSGNIFIGNQGVLGDSDTIKIGSAQTRAFIAGIRGVQTGVNDAGQVLIDSNGQLGTNNSSRRYKFDITAMPDTSATLAKLRPVTFRYKQAQKDGLHPLQYGLIAEEVADVFPDLAVFKDGQPETVKYHLLPSFLLAGYQAQQKVIDAQGGEARSQRATIETQAEQIKNQAEQLAAQEQRLRDLEARMSRLASR